MNCKACSYNCMDFYKQKQGAVVTSSESKFRDENILWRAISVLSKQCILQVSKLTASPHRLGFIKDKCTLSPRRALRRGPRLSQWQLNGFLINGELVRLNCNLMQIWSRNDSQWIINEAEAAEQKPCNSSRDSLMYSFTPDKSWRRDWIYSCSKFWETTGVIHQF